MSEHTILVTEGLAKNLGSRLQERFPEVEFVTVPMSGEMPEAARRATGFFRGFVPADRLQEVLQQLPNVRWLHAASAGLDGLLSDYVRGRLGNGSLTLTRTAHTYDAPMGEYVIASMFLLAKQFPAVMAAQRAEEWGKPIGVDIIGSTVGIIGAGNIGREVAWRARALGTKVLGLRRNPQPMEHYDEVYGVDDLDLVLAESDHVVLAMPLTSETRYMIAERELKLMKESAYLINVGRGPLIREDDLVRALNDEWIAGAVLDVFEKEPLPAGHPLWTAKNTVITPHSSGNSDSNRGRLFDEFAANLERFIAGAELNNEIRELDLGY